MSPWSLSALCRWALPLRFSLLQRSLSLSQRRPKAALKGSRCQAGASTVYRLAGRSSPVFLIAVLDTVGKKNTWGLQED